MWAVKVLLCLTVAVFCVQNTNAWWVRRIWRPWTSWSPWTPWTSWTPWSPWLWSTYSGRSRVNCESIEKAIVRRDEWNAVDPRLVQKIDGIPNMIIVQQTGPETCGVIGISRSGCEQCLRDGKCLKQLILALQDRDLSDGLNDIKYNFLIGQDGVVYKGRGWGVVGQHTDGQNAMSIGIAMIGDFSSFEPNEASKSALKDLIVCGEATKKLARDSELIAMFDLFGNAE